MIFTVTFVQTQIFRHNYLRLLNFCYEEMVWKKSNLDKNDFGNNCPISHLSLLSKLTKRVVKLRRFDYLSTNSLFNSFQTAYIKHHSTETTLFSVHDHIYPQSYDTSTSLTLFELCAAFDTVDHSILLEPLSSSFGISSTALSWICQYAGCRNWEGTCGHHGATGSLLVWCWRCCQSHYPLVRTTWRCSQSGGHCPCSEHKGCSSFDELEYCEW